jgi:large subunit ribosomal protein L7/L12
MGFLDFATRSDVRRLQAQVSRLEGLVELLARRQGVSDAELSELGLAAGPRLSGEVRLLAVQGKRIAAIRLLREQTGMGLREAKEAVDGA